MKAFLVADGRALSPAGGGLLQRLLRSGPEFTVDEIAAADADAVIRDSVARR